MASYLALMREDALQRHYPLRALFNALRYLAYPGCPGCYLPHKRYISCRALAGCVCLNILGMI